MLCYYSIFNRRCFNGMPSPEAYQMVPHNPILCGPGLTGGGSQIIPINRLNPYPGEQYSSGGLPQSGHLPVSSTGNGSYNVLSASQTNTTDGNLFFSNAHNKRPRYDSDSLTDRDHPTGILKQEADIGSSSISPRQHIKRETYGGINDQEVDGGRPEDDEYTNPHKRRRICSERNDVHSSGSSEECARDQSNGSPEADKHFRHYSHTQPSVSLNGGAFGQYDQCSDVKLEQYNSYYHNAQFQGIQRPEHSAVY